MPRPMRANISLRYSHHLPVAEWGSGYHIGGRRVVARKLLGRISAYLQLEDLESDKKRRPPPRGRVLRHFYLG